MPRRVDSDPIHKARRDAIRSALVGGGMDRDIAMRWCDAWEAEAALRGIDRGSDYWDVGRRWIDAQCAARRQPPN